MWTVNVQACPEDPNIVRLLRLNVDNQFLLYATEDGTVVIVSSLCEYVFGSPPLSVVGLNIYDLVRAQDIIALESCMSDGQRYRIRHRRVNISMWVELDEVTPNNWLNMCISSARKTATKCDGDSSHVDPALSMEMAEEDEQYHHKHHHHGSSCVGGRGRGGGGIFKRYDEYRAPVYHHIPEPVHALLRSFPCPGPCRGRFKAVTGCTVCMFSLCVDCTLDLHDLLSEQDKPINHNMYLIKPVAS